MSISSITSSPSLFSTSTVTKSADNSSTEIVTASTSTDMASSMSSVNVTISTKWGFKVDENGFFGADFNKAAGIPANVKINQTQLEMAETYTKAIGSSDDPITALGKIWSFFSKVAGNTLDPDGSMTTSQIINMPYTYQSDGSLLDNPVSVQRTDADAQKISQVSGKIQALSQGAFDTGQRSFFGGRTAGSYVDVPSELKDVYHNYVSPMSDTNEPSNEVSVGKLFGVFCWSEMGASADSHENIQNYYEYLKSEKDFQSYLTDEFGADYVKNLAHGMNTHYKDPDMFDTLMKEIDRHMKDDYASYLSSQNTTANSFLKNNDSTAKSTSSSTYQTTKNIKVPTSGSLISIGA